MSSTGTLTLKLTLTLAITLTPQIDITFTSEAVMCGVALVACSAGVGRTGAFIVIDSMLERVKHERTVDIYGHVTCLRAQRNYMVQTEDQYIFIHDALLEAVQSGNTEISARHLYAHMQKLTLPMADGSCGMCGMEAEFKVRTSSSSSSKTFFTARRYA